MQETREIHRPTLGPLNMTHLLSRALSIPRAQRKVRPTLRTPGQQTIHRCTMRHPPLQDLMGTRKTSHRRPVLSKLSSSPLAWASGERFLLRRKLLGFSCLHLNEHLIFLSSTEVGV